MYSFGKQNMQGIMQNFLKIYKSIITSIKNSHYTVLKRVEVYSNPTKRFLETDK